MPNDKPRPMRYFLCNGYIVPYEKLHEHPNSHIIGHLCDVSDQGRSVTALARWDKSVSAATVPLLNPRIDCMIIGDVRSIRCRYPGCEHKERWEIGKAAFLALMSRYGKDVMPES